MTVQQVKNLNDLMTETLEQGYSSEIYVIKKGKKIVAYGAKMVKNLEKAVTVRESFKGSTPLEAYSKLADAMAEYK